MSLTIVAVPDFREEAAGTLQTLRGAGVRVGLADRGASGIEDALAALASEDASLALIRGDALLTSAPSDVTIAAVLPRGEPRDVLVPADPGHATLAALPAGSRVGTGGVRRASFLRAHRPDLIPVRGWNGGGPGEELDSGAFDAIILGATDSRRWGVAHRATEALDAKAWVPAAGQGTPLLVCRTGDRNATECGALVDQEAARAAFEAERATRRGLGASREGPLGVLALPFGRWMRVWGMVAALDGRSVVRGDVTGALDAPQSVGRRLAELLLARGAAQLLDEAAHS